MADADWSVTVLTAPIRGFGLMFPEHPGITIRALPARRSHVFSKSDYLAYLCRAVSLARQIRPDVVYASDPLGAGPGLAAATAVGARLVYHEHDSPAPGAAATVLSILRRIAARRADAVIFPNIERARLAQGETGFSSSRLHIIWNMPRRKEIPPAVDRPEVPLIFHYHGNISPLLLPEELVRAVGRLGGSVRLRIAGYEAPGAVGYVAEMQQLARSLHGANIVEYLGTLSRSDLLGEAARAHVGVALMPSGSDDINMQNMTGASNKIFDYMAAGLATLVSDLPDWHEVFVARGLARACDPSSVDSIVAALSWFRDNPSLRHAMAARGREKIQSDWNYDTAFAPLIRTFQGWADARAGARAGV